MSRQDFYYIIRSSFILLIFVFPISLLIEWILNLINPTNDIDLTNTLHLSYLISNVLAYLVVIKRNNQVEEPTFVLILRIVLLNLIQLGFLFLILNFNSPKFDLSESNNTMIVNLFVILALDIIKLRKSFNK